MLKDILTALQKMTAIEIFFYTVGALGQVCFGARFVIQWIASERKKRSYIPGVFWYFSVAGSWMLLTYSIFKKDPIFIIGSSLNSVIYVRNIFLLKKETSDNE